MPNPSKPDQPEMQRGPRGSARGGITSRKSVFTYQAPNVVFACNLLRLGQTRILLNIHSEY